MKIDQFRWQLCGQNLLADVWYLSGADSESFLQSQCTRDLRNLQAGQALWACFLDRVGKIQSWFFVAKGNDDWRLISGENFRSAINERLEKFIISEDVVWELKTQTALHYTWGSPSGDYALEWLGQAGHLTFGELPANITLFAGELLKQASWAQGYPLWNDLKFKFELLNQSRLFQIALDQKKGCYPGQETVAKIDTHRGAATFPVLLKVLNGNPKRGDVVQYDRKVGHVSESFSVEGQAYLTADLSRDLRVAQLKCELMIAGDNIKAEVLYLPLWVTSSVDKALELFHQGTELFKNGDDLGALHLFEQATYVDPACADAYEAAGVLLGRLGKYQEGIEWMERLLKVKPNSVLAHTNTSLFLMKLGKIEEAEKHKSLATVASFAQFGEEAKIKEQQKAAVEKQTAELNNKARMFAEVLEIDPDDVLAHFGLGGVALARTEYEQAVIHLEKVLKVDARHSAAHLALGKAFLALGKKAAAKDIWEKGIKVAAGKGELMPANEMQGLLSKLNG